MFCLSFREVWTSRRCTALLPGGFPTREESRQGQVTEEACPQVEFHFSELLGSDRYFEELASLAVNRDVSC